jgi:secreted trypsin-like serine protease
MLRAQLPVRMARALAATIFAVLAIVGLTSAQAQAIANGEPVAAGQYRFAVKLTMTHIPRVDGTFYDSACSGALVARQWIITAGHCFHDAARNRVGGPVPYPTTATIGRVEATGPGGHDIAVVEVRQSPANDIAIGKLAQPVTDIAPLAISRRAPVVGDVVRATGWGALDGVNTVPATHLQTGLFTVSSVAPTTLGVVGRSPSPSTSACPYDSGAPYFREQSGRTELVSIESTGPDCPHDQEETTSRADLPAAIAWLRQQTA